MEFLHSNRDEEGKVCVSTAALNGLSSRWFETCSRNPAALGRKREAINLIARTMDEVEKWDPQVKTVCF